jgi:hypothetical protein
VVVLEAQLEAVEVEMHVGRFLVCLRGAAPHRHQSIHLLLRPKTVDVLHQRLGALHVVGAGLDLVGSLEISHPPRGEHRRHGFHRPQLVTDPLDVAGVEDAGLHGCGVGVIRVGIPTTELEVFERCQRDELLDEWVPAFISFPEADVGQLGEGPGRLSVALAGGEDTGDERGGYRAHPGGEDAELPGGRDDGAWLFHFPPGPNDTDGPELGLNRSGLVSSP